MKFFWLAMGLGLASCSSPPAPEPAAEATSSETLTVEEEFWPKGVYTPLPIQGEVDRSFSEIPIETPLAEVQFSLTQILRDDCEEFEECGWANDIGVRHHFLDSGQAGHILVLKSVHAEDFENRSVPALGIDLMRSRDEVVAVVRQFLGDTGLSCATPTYCSAFLGPGWIALHFDQTDQLEKVWFAGFDFT